MDRSVPPWSGRSLLTKRAGWLVALGLAAVAVAYLGVPARRPSAPVHPSGTPTSALVPAPRALPAAGLPPAAAPSVGSPGEQAQPVELTISSIGVRSRLVDLNRNPDGTLTVPSDYQVAGWYANGPSPGDSGGPPAVVAGHVDSADGPAVFYRLKELRAGSDIAVRGIDNVVRHFTVYRMAEYAKTTFPAGEVYAPSGKAELRLITCSGDFDRRSGSYRSNLVAYATFTRVGS
ncbi:class F sortase [Micromonospora vulcania]|uniref:Class F sortase n=1 Tax=Micromonospora vulcania TaxID=1441873 RepID=A0ABW1HEJ9_9ACTN